MKKDGWKNDKIGNYITQVSNKNKDLSVDKVVSVTKYNGIVDSLEYFDKEVFSKDLSGYKIIEKNQFAYSTIHLNEGSLGYLNICDKAVLSPMYTVFKINEEKLNKDFLYSLLKSHKYINIYNQIGEGSIDRRASISFDKFKDIEILVPPLKEQQKIAEILSTVDAQIDDTDKLIEKTKELKKGLMQRLLTKGIGHKEFKMTEVGEIPVEWEVKNLNKIVHIYYGKSQKYVEVSDGKYKILGTGGVIGYTNDFLWDKPSVLIGRKGTIDKPQYIEEPFWTVDTLFYTKIKDDNLAKWLFYSLNNIDLKKYNEATGVPSLSVSNLSLIKIITPSPKEQKEIVDILSSVDTQIEEYENKKSKLEELKKALMQQLLTGKIRVV